MLSFLFAVRKGSVEPLASTGCAFAWKRLEVENKMSVNMSSNVKDPVWL